ncbi:MAG TPA: chaperonin GroEL, partial [Saprospiraceae bacterium]|nr:chaperonin GroEL [Saprospiraceae bacterium]
VIGVYPKGKKKICKVKFGDGHIVECCEDHLWQITTNYGHDRIMTVRQIIDSGKIKVSKPDGNSAYGYYTPSCKVEFSEKKENMPIDPYLLGLLIGDGSLSGTGGIELSLGPNKKHVLDKMILPEGIKFTATFVEHKNYYRIKLTGKTNNEDGHIQHLLKKLGIFGTKSDTKFIPKPYLYSSLISRQRLFEGLMDTDGYYNSRGNFEFTTVSTQLSKDFVELCRGLGLHTKIDKMERKEGSGSYSSTPIYRMFQRNGYKHGIKLIDIEETDEIIEMQCIKVSNPDNLYITDDYVITHNTTTATVLVQSIITQGLQKVADGANAIDIKRGIDKAVIGVVEYLKNKAIPVDDNAILNIATISANNDEVIGKLISDGMLAVGRDGVIKVQDSKGLETEMKVVEGMEFERGFLSPYFVNNYAKKRVEYERTLILIIDKKISVITDKFIPAIDAAIKSQLPLLIICDDMDGEALVSFAMNNHKGQMKVCVVKVPGYTEAQKKDNMEDIAALTGATIIGDERATYIENVGSNTMDMFGAAESITVSQNMTTIIGGQGDPSGVADRITHIKNTLATVENEQEKRFLTSRLGKLAGKVAILFIGAGSEIEAGEKKDRIDDALHATRAAVEEGIVPGGGVAYIRALEGIKDLIGLNKDEDDGINIIREAIESPMRHIVNNSVGNKAEDIVNKVKEGTGGFGYNARTEEYCDLIAAGVIDPAKVSRVALQNAASVASMILTTECLMVEGEEKNNQ